MRKGAAGRRDDRPGGTRAQADQYDTSQALGLRGQASVARLPTAD
jgi:hypothetical protein